MAEGFQQSTDDIKHIANIVPGEDSDIVLSGYVELYQLIALEKAIQDSKATSKVAAAAEGMVAKEIKYLALALEEMKTPAIQKEYGNDIAGAKKLAKAIFKRDVQTNAEAGLDKMVAKLAVARGDSAFGA